MDLVAVLIGFEADLVRAVYVHATRCLGENWRLVVADSGTRCTTANAIPKVLETIFLDLPFRITNVLIKLPFRKLSHVKFLF